MFRYEINIALDGQFWGCVDLHDMTKEQALHRAGLLQDTLGQTPGEWSITVMMWTRETGRTIG